jgi:hypothetical protein
VLQLHFFLLQHQPLKATLSSLPAAISHLSTTVPFLGAASSTLQAAMPSLSAASLIFGVFYLNATFLNIKK